MLGFILDSRKHYWGSIQRRHCIQPRQLFLFVYNIRAAQIKVSLGSFTGSASWLKLTVAAVSGKINFTSALFPIWKFCWIDRGWLESWQRPTGEMDISVDTTPKRDERDAFVGSNQMKDTFVSWKDIFVGSQWKSWTLTRTNAPPSFCLHSFFSSKFPRTKMKIVRLIKR